MVLIKLHNSKNWTVALSTTMEKVGLFWAWNVAPAMDNTESFDTKVACYYAIKINFWIEIKCSYKPKTCL